MEKPGKKKNSLDMRLIIYLALAVCYKHFISIFSLWSKY